MSPTSLGPDEVQADPDDSRARPRGLTRPKTLTHAVIDHIAEAVIRGTYPPGSPLPEVTLAAELNTARGTVREALRALRDRGLVEIHPHRGAFVQSIGEKRVREVFNLRALLECYALRTAMTAGYIDEAPMGTIQAAFSKLDDAYGRGDLFAVVDADIELHYVIASTCREDLLLDHLKSIQMETRRVIILTKVLDSDTSAEPDTHRPIIEAIEAGDVELAVSRLDDHICQSREQLLARLRERDSS
ncbi:GntR family transcriptional regulator [Mycolicibacterium sp. 050158]|uniref:GntR family transcriptional regulator n=1 Tax=Mycobacteriaceae TaxID=1762 RepID=UPI00299E1091|nr:GntR family transcriptional regulator [Mycolicibacterium sp. 050158]MDX1888013.1 GntR family transcriptional regulator [Mycolicibacterium sp. 050158]